MSTMKLRDDVKRREQDEFEGAHREHERVTQRTESRATPRKSISNSMVTIGGRV
jgi:hypothetical protein